MSAQAIRHPGEFRWETRLLAVLTLMLTAMGIASCYASGAYVEKWFREASQQGVAALVGGAVFLLAAKLDYRIWRKVALPAFIATLAGLVVIGIVAVIWRKQDAPGPLKDLFPYINGAHRWVRVGLQVQVSEIARFTLTVWLAAYCASLGNKVRDFNEGYLPLIGVIAIVCGLVALEPSVSMAGTLGIIGLTVVFTAGAKLPHVVTTVALALLAMFLVLKFDAVRKQRTETFKGSTIECDVGKQECEALIGYGSGGINGVGFGNGTQKLGHTAEAYSDYLLSVIGEEWGFLGIVFIVACFTLFCWMGFRISRTAPDPFGTYLAAGLTMSVGVTAFLHAAVVTAMMPSTGLTLPFMSVGRISLLFYLLSAGVIVSIGRQRGRPARTK